MNSYNQLTLKLDNFIRKYYKNMLLRGSIIAAVLLTTAFVFAAVAEYYGHFSITVRTIIFYTFAGGALYMLGRYVIMPLIKLFKLGKNISYKEASTIITQHFSQIQDKLLNTLELYELNNNNSQPDPLLAASIEQKIGQITIFPFRKAVNYKENYKYLKYLVVVLLLFGALLMYSPSIFSESSSRLMNHSEFYEKPAPFSFALVNDTLTAKKGDDFMVEVEISGEYIPDNVNITYGSNTFAMRKKDKTTFEYNFRNLNNSLDFKFVAEEFSTKNYTINVLPSPTIIDFSLFADVPDYTGEPDKTFKNTGDLIIPYGTKLNWNFITKNISKLKFVANDSLESLAEKNGDIFTVSKSAKNNFDYSISVENEFFSGEKLVEYNITVVPDLYPAIRVNELRDSANFFLTYFRGNIGDDYGVRMLTFNYRIVNPDSNTISSGAFEKLNISITPSMLKQEFYHVFNFSDIKIPDGKVAEYFFQVWDNDGVNGSKSSKTEINEFKVPSSAEITEMQNQANEEIKNNVEKTADLAKELQEEIAKMREKSLNGEMSEWERTQMLKNIMQKQNEMQQLIQETADKNKSKNQMQNELTEEQEAMLEKQKQIEELMENVMTDEMKDLLKQIEDLQNNFDKDKLNEISEEMDMSMEDMQKQLDRNLEMLKRFEVEQKVEKTIDELNKLAEEQENLAEDTENKLDTKENLEERQKEINEKFEQIAEEYKKTEELNDELKSPMKMDEITEEEESIKEDMKDSGEKLSKGKNKKASKSQKSSSSKMKKMAKKMKETADSNGAEDKSENMENLRQIADNLLAFSFRQEKLMGDIKEVYMNDPKFLEYTKDQLNLNDDFSVIRDSLYALAERVPQINSTVTKELLSVKKNSLKSSKALDARKKTVAQVRQQEVMTSANNLALLLSQILEQMQKESNGDGEGGEGKPKPGKGKPGKGKPGKGGEPSMSDMKGMQESLKKQLEQMLKEMQGGQNPGGKGGKGTMGSKGDKMIAKMLAQQEILRQMMQDMKAKNNLSPETQRILNEIDKLAQENEKDFVNKRITPQLLERQNRIKTRMLEAESAEEEREQDKKRKSTAGLEKKYQSPEDFFKEKDMNEGFKENLYHNSLKMRNFYKSLYDNYSDQINK